ncbi:tegument protein UL51 [Testudinid alphaherpesvirus 3]|uniref:Tegument protein UL51 n=1 Tax=Testudinid alphaherpesvirus 3 TaxID=2560801 RepID=A0A0K1R1D3_9ALPH|nr:tegument protein UL51 [Testudinid alphaherpesvirus 3]AIU39250.1 tegument protein UL51 [Testudinid alphaherpesvirus 3]AIU39360.1 tegument protein UL51 [Testudinid alphaherpesvirus 3]AKI81636.1 tegument protein UL51 [Testudinid alphaherpesvirus 3]AKI81740.1 tegument protein UL51 [Testudinid alphaherpesvirus 3]AKV40720.1 UL51 tegument protein [Testudinid alphaherpesvirus 3]
MFLVEAIKRLCSHPLGSNAYLRNLPYSSPNEEIMITRKKADDAVATIRLFLPVSVSLDEIINSDEMAKRLEIAKKLADKLVACTARISLLEQACDRAGPYGRSSLKEAIAKETRAHRIYYSVLIKLKLYEGDFDNSPIVNELLKSHAEEQLMENDLNVLERALNLGRDHEAQFILEDIIRDMSSSSPEELPVLPEPPIEEPLSQTEDKRVRQLLSE